MLSRDCNLWSTFLFYLSHWGSFIIMCIKRWFHLTKLLRCTSVVSKVFFNLLFSVLLSPTALSCDFTWFQSQSSLRLLVVSWRASQNIRVHMIAFSDVYIHVINVYFCFSHWLISRIICLFKYLRGQLLLFFPKSILFITPIDDFSWTSLSSPTCIRSKCCFISFWIVWRCVSAIINTKDIWLQILKFLIFAGLPHFHTLFNWRIHMRLL